jgi:predicted DNA-binding protein with PD1-like motif
MHYASGSPGRIFYIVFDHGEDLLLEIQNFVAEHQIRSGIIHLIGAVSGGSLVTGSKITAVPPEFMWETISDVHDLVGIGMIRSGPDGPKVHVHAAAGWGRSTLTGCFRKDTRVYLVIEAVIIEFAGFSVSAEWDEKTNSHLPYPENAGSDP